MPQIFKLPSTRPKPHSYKYKHTRAVGSPLIYLILLQLTKRKLHKSRRNRIIRFRFFLFSFYITSATAALPCCHAVNRRKFYYWHCQMQREQRQQQKRRSVASRFSPRLSPVHSLCKTLARPSREEND